jgi:hypothetical protein
MFPALGFGAKLQNGQVSHEFYLVWVYYFIWIPHNTQTQNGHPTDPTCIGVDGVLSAYRQAIMSYQLYGPTNFAPVIYHVAKYVCSCWTVYIKTLCRFAAAAAKDGGHYFVLLIITDGVISDIEQTKQAIVYVNILHPSYKQTIILRRHHNQCQL